MGYNNVFNLGNMSDFINCNSLEAHILIGKESELETNLKVFLSEILENSSYSIIPILRYQVADNEYKSVTISKSIKITRYTSSSLLTKRLSLAIIDAISIYDLNDYDIDLFILSRPWLSAKDFNSDLSTVSKELDGQIEKEIKFLRKSSELNTSKKVNRLKFYKH